MFDRLLPPLSVMHRRESAVMICRWLCHRWRHVRPGCREVAAAPYCLSCGRRVLRHVFERASPDSAGVECLPAARAAAAQASAAVSLDTQVRRDPAQVKRCSRPHRHQQCLPGMLLLLTKQRIAGPESEPDRKIAATAYGSAHMITSQVRAHRLSEHRSKTLMTRTPTSLQDCFVRLSLHQQACEPGYAGGDTSRSMQSLLRGLAARSAAGASASAIGGVAAQRHVSMHSRGHASVRCRAGKRLCNRH